MTIVKQFIVLLSNCFVSIYQDNPIFLWELGQYLVLDFRTQNCCTSEVILLGHTAESSNGKPLSTEPFPIWTRIDHVKPHSTHYGLSTVWNGPVRGSMGLNRVNTGSNWGSVDSGFPLLDSAVWPKRISSEVQQFWVLKSRNRFCPSSQSHFGPD